MTDDIRLERLASHLHRLGPRAICEALREALDHGDLDRLEAYRRLSPDMLAITGGDGFPPRMVIAPTDDEDDELGRDAGRGAA